MTASTANHYEIVVIGGGPGGYATALRAAGHGLRVAIVESDRVGGTCLHRGCIPSKALLHVAALADAVPELIELGLVQTGAPLDITAAGERRDRVVDQLHRGLRHLISSRSIEVIEGWGRIGEPGVVDVATTDGQGLRLRAEHLVIATGSVPIDIASAPRDGERILSSDDALRLERVPTTAVIIGGGAIGVEFASMWNSFGSEVTIIEAAADILPNEDPDSSKTLRRAFAKRGIRCLIGATLTSSKVTDERVLVETDGGDRFEVDQVLVAVGRRPATKNLGLEDFGVVGADGAIVVDEFGRTEVPGLWAVGDAVPTLALAHAAFAEGFVVADSIAGIDPEPVNHRLVPRVTYCTPEVASVGYTEPEARATFDAVTTTVASLAGNARSIIEGQPGTVKVVLAADGTLLGGHIVGPSATELIAELGLAVSWDALAGEVAGVVHAHPSLAESIREAALAGAGHPFHLH